MFIRRFKRNPFQYYFSRRSYINISRGRISYSIRISRILCSLYILCTWEYISRVPIFFWPKLRFVLRLQREEDKFRRFLRSRFFLEILSARYRIQLSHSNPYRSKRKRTRDNLLCFFRYSAGRVPTSVYSVQLHSLQKEETEAAYVTLLALSPIRSFICPPSTSDNKRRSAELPFKRRVSYMIPEMAAVQAH